MQSSKKPNDTLARIFAVTLMALLVLTAILTTTKNDVLANMIFNISHRDELTGGLVGYWTFDGADVNWSTNKAIDKSGQGNDGTMTNMATTTSPTIGKIGQGLNFDGANDYVNAGQAANLNNLGPMTFSAWIKPRSLGQANGGFIADKSSWGLRLNDATADWALKMQASHNGVQLRRVSVASAIVPNTWQHVLGTYDGSSTATNIHLYINGVEVAYADAQNGTAGRVSDIGIDLILGNSIFFNSAFDGVIDDARIYNRALPPEEIKRLYLQGASLKIHVASHPPIIRTLDDPANSVGQYTSIAIGIDGNPVISYYDATALSLKFYKCNDATCRSGTASTLDDPANNVGTSTSIAIGTDGYPVISYFDNTALSLKFYKCNDAACSTGTASTLDDPANSVGQYTSIAIGTDGYPVISYYDATAGALKLYKCNDASCATGTASTLDDPANNVGQYTSIAIGTDGYPVISYYDSAFAARNLMFYKCDNVACSSGTASTLSTGITDDGQYSDIAIGSDGYPVISYYETANFSLRFYKCDNAACSTGNYSILDPLPDRAGQFSSIAIGTDGYPVISYYAGTNDFALKLYKCDNVACSTGTASLIDNPATGVGQYTSIAIGTDGYPVISYYDLINQALKFLSTKGEPLLINVSHRDELTSGLVGYWTFDGKDTHWNTNTVDDVSTNGNTGTMTNMATTTSPTIGKIGQGLLFDGVNDSVTVADSGSMNITGSLTASAWIYPKSYGGASYSRIIERDSEGAGLLGYVFLLNNIDVSNGLEFCTNACGAADDLYIGNAITLNTWQFVSVTFTGGLVTLYVNGVSVGTKSSVTAPASVSDSLTIGARLIDNNRNFDGIIDEVRVYNRALSSDEIRRLYLMGR